MYLLELRLRNEKASKINLEAFYQIIFRNFSFATGERRNRAWLWPRWRWFQVIQYITWMEIWFSGWLHYCAMFRCLLKKSIFFCTGWLPEKDSLMKIVKRHKQLKRCVSCQKVSSNFSRNLKWFFGYTATSIAHSILKFKKVRNVSELLRALKNQLNRDRIVRQTDQPTDLLNRRCPKSPHNVTSMAKADFSLTLFLLCNFSKSPSPIVIYCVPSF